MYRVTIYDISNPDKSIVVKKSDSVRSILECKVIWYCVKRFPIRYTHYEQEHSETDDILVFVHGEKVAKIVFDNTPPEPELAGFGLLV